MPTILWLGDDDCFNKLARRTVLLAVVDEKGNTIGQVRKDSVLNVLIDQE